MIPRRDRAPCVVHHGLVVATAGVELDPDPAGPPLARDLGRPLGESDLGHIGERYVRAVPAVDHESPHVLNLGASRGGETHDQVESPITLEDLARPGPAEGRLERLRRLRDRDPVSRERDPVEPDHGLGKAGRLLDANVLRAPDAAHDLGDPRRPVPKHLEVVAEEFDRHIRAYARDEFVDAEFDRLAKRVAHTRHRRESLLHLVDKILLRHSGAPLGGVAELHEDVRDVRPHRIGREFRRPRL